MSPESRFIGYLVLGFGVLAMITVLILAFGGGDDLDIDRTTDDPALTQTLSAEIAAGNNNAAPQTDVQKDSDKLVLARQKINTASLEGGWQASIDPYVAVIQMQKGAFQVILARTEPGLPRLYSSGTYTSIDDIIVFSPRLDWNAPQAPAGTSISYERLTTGTYSMIAGFKDNAMVWQNVPADDDRVASHKRSPLLVESGQNYIVWKKIN